MNRQVPQLADKDEKHHVDRFHVGNNEGKDADWLLADPGGKL